MKQQRLSTSQFGLQKIGFLFVFIFSMGIQAQKSDLKILYAGSLKTNRTKDFKALLEQHFNTIGITEYETFKPIEADNYDVVVFDWNPDKVGYAPELMLPKSFTKPSVTIGSVGPAIGAPLRLKIDALCLCMDYGAQNIMTDHAIFNTPNKVNLTYETAKTPPDFKHHLLGKDLGETIQVWRVQTKGFDELTPGMVSTGHGFSNSPDAEFISGGMCMKGPESVAIGRHANYFQWGFVAQPKDLTEDAKLAFINAIHYIKKFDGQQALVTIKEGAQSREYALENAYYVSLSEEIYNDELKQYESIEKRIENGEKISDDDREILELKAYLAPNAEAMLDENLEAMFTKEQIERFGRDSNKYMAYFKENLEYLYTKNYLFYVDEDAKKIGISNRSIDVLEYAISSLENNKDTEVANRLLDKYTTETFTSAKAWRTWFEANKTKLFFTDVGGYKFKINTL